MKSPADYMNEIGAWADKCFPVHIPEYGIVEEIGETVHCILKRAQKIRKMDKEEIFKPAITDAFADTMIYLLHLCYLFNVTVSFDAHRALLPKLSGVSVYTDRAFISACLKCSATLLDYCDYAQPGQELQSNLFMVPCQKLCNTLFLWANQYEVNLLETLDQTWEKVKQRQWDKDRETAHENVA